ncbi:unnamed protein product [Sphagnum balticum]
MVFQSLESKGISLQYARMLVAMIMAVAFSLMMAGNGRVEAGTGTMSIRSEFATNMSIVCYSNNIINPTFVATPAHSLYIFPFDTVTNWYYDCAFMDKLAVPFRAGTFRFWGNPNVPGSNASTLHYCIDCSWDVNNSGMFLQQPDHTFKLIWQWPA